MHQAACLTRRPRKPTNLLLHLCWFYLHVWWQGSMRISVLYEVRLQSLVLTSTTDLEGLGCVLQVGLYLLDVKGGQPPLHPLKLSADLPNDPWAEDCWCELTFVPLALPSKQEEVLGAGCSSHQASLHASS